jgi:hypothetical protein
MNSLAPKVWPQQQNGKILKNECNIYLVTFLSMVQWFVETFFLNITAYVVPLKKIAAFTMGQKHEV